MPQIGLPPSGRSPLSGPSLAGSFRRSGDRAHRMLPRSEAVSASLRLRTLPFPGLSKIIAAAAATCPRFQPAVRLSTRSLRRCSSVNFTTGVSATSGIRVSSRSTQGRVPVGFPALEVRGLEPLTYGLQSHRSSQLSYTPGEPKNSNIRAGISFSQYSKKRGTGKGRAPKGSRLQ